MKHTLIIGTDFRRSSLKMRERVHMDDSVKPSIIREIKEIKGISECVIVTTCNRVEIYLICDEPVEARVAVVSLLSRLHGIEKGVLEDKLYIYRCDDAVRHLFRVVSGLSSMVIGEAEILGQIKRAYLLAKNARGPGPFLNKLFQTAIALGKEVRTKTPVNEGITSLGSAAAKLATELVDPEKALISVIGCGEIGSIVAKNLIRRGARKVHLSNRSIEAATNLGKTIGGVAIPFDRLDELILHSDLIVSATAADSYILTKARLEHIMRERSKLIIIDIAVPRDVEPEAESIPGLEIHTIERLQETVDKNIKLRESSVELISQLIENKLGFYTKWYLRKALYEEESPYRKPWVASRAPTGRNSR